MGHAPSLPPHARVVAQPVHVAQGRDARVRAPPRQKPSSRSAALSHAAGSVTPTGSDAEGSTPSPLPPSGRYSSPATATPNPLLGAPCRCPKVEVCIVPCTMEVVSNEVALERALVVSVAGTSPDISPTKVKEFLEARLGVLPGSFLVYPHHPDEFLVMFRDVDAMLCVLHAPMPIDGL
ncbi:unnamed protein product [Urochloa humidicola]